MRTLAAAVLAFEAVVIVLLVPVAITLGGVDATVAVALGALAFVACVAVAGMLRHRWAYALGWALQVVLVACGFVVPAMFFLGTLFAVLWGAALVVGRRGEELRAQRYAAAGVDDPKRPPAGPASAATP